MSWDRGELCGGRDRSVWTAACRTGAESARNSPFGRKSPVHYNRTGGCSEGWDSFPVSLWRSS
eukprot:scaffold2927_cov268-Chaetoceros_neogracile.AAC.11